jgi:hypothetical protein
MASGSRFNVEDPRFDGGGEPVQAERYDGPPVEPPARRRSCLATCFFGCLITFVVLVILGGIAVYWVMQHGREFAANIGSAVIKQAVEATELPAQEKAEIGVQVDRLAVAVREKRISDEQLEELLKKIVESPLMTTMVVSAIESKYVTNSGLSEKEKTESRQALRRYMRGAIDNKIDQEGTDAAMKYVADRQPDGSWQLRDKVTDDDLRAFFKEAKAQADKAEIPAEAEDIDPSDEFERIIDEAMAAPAQAPAE